MKTGQRGSAPAQPGTGACPAPGVGTQLAVVADGFEDSSHLQLIHPGEEAPGLRGWVGPASGAALQHVRP